MKKEHGTWSPVSSNNSIKMEVEIPRLSSRSTRAFIKSQLQMRGELQTGRSTHVFKSNEASIRLQIVRIAVTDECLEYLAQNFDDDVILQLEWELMNFEKTTTNKFKLTDTTQFMLDYSIFYRYEATKQFVKYILQNKIVFQLIASDIQRSKTVAWAKLVLNHILQEDGEDGYSYDLKFFTRDPDKSRSEQLFYAELNILLRMKMDSEKLRHLLEVILMEAGSDDSSNSVDSSEDEQQRERIRPTESEIDSFREALDLVLIRNKALKTTQSEISNELKDRARWLHEECNWRRTLQEYSILNEKNPFEVQWRQWRDQTTAKLKPRRYCSKTEIGKPQLSITVVQLNLYPQSSVMLDENIEKLYVEYTFLHHEGPELETPYSLKKQETIIYNFKENFPLYTSKTKSECKMLAGQVKRKECIKFVVISEPEPSKDNPIVTCEEVGYAEIQLADLLESMDDESENDYPVKNWSRPEEVIGELRVKLEGLLSLRRVTLITLSPSDYNIIK